MVAAWVVAGLARGDPPGAAVAPPRNSTPAPVTRAVAVEPAGQTPLTPDGETVVDPASSFEVQLATRVADCRLVLLDAADAHVAARENREIGPATKLALTPAAPLVPGSHHVLRVEGGSGRELRDGDRAFAPASFRLLVAGTPPPPEPKRKAKKRRR